MDILTLFYFDGKAMNLVSVHGVDSSNIDDDFIASWVNVSDYNYPPCGYAVYESEFGFIWDYEIVPHRSPEYFTLEYISNTIRQKLL